MPTFRSYDLANLFNDLDCLSQTEAIKVSEIDPNNIAEVRKVVEQWILPWFRRQTEVRRHEIKMTLRYYLTMKDESVVRSILHGVQESPLHLPKNTIELLGLVWSVLSPGENPILAVPDAWKEEK